MTKSKKKEKKPEELEVMNSDQVMQHVFGKRGAQVLKNQLLSDDPEPEETDSSPTDEV